MSHTWGSPALGCGLLLKGVCAHAGGCSALGREPAGHRDVQGGAGAGACPCLCAAAASAGRLLGVCASTCATCSPGTPDTQQREALGTKHISLCSSAWRMGARAGARSRCHHSPALKGTKCYVCAGVPGLQGRGRAHHCGAELARQAGHGGGAEGSAAHRRPAWQHHCRAAGCAARFAAMAMIKDAVYLRACTPSRNWLAMLRYKKCAVHFFSSPV